MSYPRLDLERRYATLSPPGLPGRVAFDPCLCSDWARYIKGVRGRVGIASVKFLARLAAEQAGRGGVVRVPAGGEARFLADLPVSVLPGVGPRTLATLRGLQTERVGQLAVLGRDALERALGNHGLRLLEFARGEDAQRVRAVRRGRGTGKAPLYRGCVVCMKAAARRSGRHVPMHPTPLGRRPSGTATRCGYVRP